MKHTGQYRPYPMLRPTEVSMELEASRCTYVSLSCVVYFYLRRHFLRRYQTFAVIVLGKSFFSSDHGRRNCTSRY